MSFSYTWKEHDHACHSQHEEPAPCRPIHLSRLCLQQAADSNDCAFYTMTYAALLTYNPPVRVHWLSDGTKKGGALKAEWTFASETELFQKDFMTPKWFDEGRVAMLRRRVRRDFMVAMMHGEDKDCRPTPDQCDELVGMITRDTRELLKYDFWPALL